MITQELTAKCMQNAAAGSLQAPDTINQPL